MEMIDFTLELSKLNFVIHSAFHDATSLRKVRIQEVRRSGLNIERPTAQQTGLIAREKNYTQQSRRQCI